MKAPNKELRSFVYSRLNNAVVVNAVTIPVCSVPAKNQAFPYIDLGNISLTDAGAKDRTIFRAQFEINVYTKFADENTSYTSCEDISSALLERLIDYEGQTTNFNIECSHFISSQELFEQNETEKAISNQIIIEFFCEQI